FRGVLFRSCGEASLPSLVTVTVHEPTKYSNWIRETVVLQQCVTSEGQIETLAITDGEKSVNYSYFDDLGRPMQQVAVQSSPLGWDVVQPILYDEFGREVKKYLPYTSNQNNGWYKVESTGDGSYSSYLSSDQYLFYQTGARKSVV